MDVRTVLAIFVTIAAIAAAAAGIVLPPLGVIDNSILWFVAQALLFVATLLELPNLKILTRFMEKSPTPKK